MVTGVSVYLLFQCEQAVLQAGQPGAEGVQLGGEGGVLGLLGCSQGE